MRHYYATFGWLKHYVVAFDKPSVRDEFVAKKSSAALRTKAAAHKMLRDDPKAVGVNVYLETMLSDVQRQRINSCGAYAHKLPATASNDITAV